MMALPRGHRIITPDLVCCLVLAVVAGTEAQTPNDSSAPVSTDELSRNALKRRAVFYEEIMVALGVLLVLLMCAAVWVKSGRLSLGPVRLCGKEIGPLEFTAAGWSWAHRPLRCCGCCHSRAHQPLAGSPEEAAEGMGASTEPEESPGGQAEQQPPSKSALRKDAGAATASAPQGAGGVAAEGGEAYLERLLAMEEAERGGYARWLRFRLLLLSTLFAMYAGASVGIPLLFRSSVSCSAGFFWENHLPFMGCFLLTKIAELSLYIFDPTVHGELSVATFALKFFPSCLGYIDGYTDSTAVLIARSCPGELSQTLGFWMGATFLLGVFFAQWVVVALVSCKDSTQACLMKLLHMDALSVCISLPASNRWIWTLVNVVRTVGEDLPQSFLQTLFILHIRRNPFMLLSVAVGIVSSLKAIHDALRRGAAALGAKAPEDSKRWTPKFDPSQLKIQPAGSESLGTFSLDAGEPGPSSHVPSLRLVTLKAGRDDSIGARFDVPQKVASVANAVEVHMKQQSLEANGVYCNLQLADRTDQEGRLEIKFDKKNLRAYGKPVTADDISVPVSSVEAGQWCHLVVKISWEEQRVAFVVDGQPVREIQLRRREAEQDRGPWVRVAAVILKGWAQRRTSWWDGLAVYKSDESDSA